MRTSLTIGASRAVAADVAAAIVAGDAIVAGAAAMIVAAVSDAWEMAARTNLAREKAAADAADDDPPDVPSETCPGHPALPNEMETVTTAAAAAAAPVYGAVHVPGAEAIVVGAAAMTIVAVFALEMAARMNLARNLAAAGAAAAAAVDPPAVSSETWAEHPALRNETAATTADVVAADTADALAVFAAPTGKYSND
jgi:hypothetical protein